MEWLIKFCAVFLLFSNTSASVRSSLLPRNVENFIHNLGLRSLLPQPLEPRDFNVSGTVFTYTQWSNYTACDKICGGGSQHRSRRCLSELGEEVAIENCARVSRESVSPIQVLAMFLNGEDLTTEIESASCNVQPCAVSDWSGWDPCSYPCGGGVQTSYRTCLNSADASRCNFQHRRSRRCNDFNCFRMGQWSAWGNCSKECDTGIAARSRQCEAAVVQSERDYYALNFFLSQLNSYESFRINALNFGTDTLQGHYLREYRKSCNNRPTNQRTHCNRFACPTCPHNQVYSSCKPCTRSCRPTLTIPSLQNIFNFDIRSLLSNPLGCDGVCEAGCTCPPLFPYMGSDQRCYQFEFLCPVMNRVIGSAGIPGFGGDFQATVNPVPVHSTNLPTTTSPSTTSEVSTTSSGVVSTAGIPACEYLVVIATSPGYIPCVCDGDLQSVDCYSTGTTSCPVMCLPETSSPEEQ